MSVSNSFHRLCYTALFVGGLIPGIVSAQTTANNSTSSRICEVFMLCSKHGYQFLPNHIPGFKLFFDQIPLTAEQRILVDKKICLFPDLKQYYQFDKLIASIMKDPSLKNDHDKKTLILCILEVGSPTLPPHLVPYIKKINDRMEAIMEYTNDEKNWAEIEQYSKTQAEQTAKGLKMMKELGKLGESAEALEKELRK